MSAAEENPRRFSRQTPKTPHSAMGTPASEAMGVNHLSVVRGLFKPYRVWQKVVYVNNSYV